MIAITPRSIVNIKSKGVDVKVIYDLYKHWKKELKTIQLQK